MAKHRLIWLSNRNTPKVVTAGTGKRYKPKPSEGRVVKSRMANKSEERTIARGGWVRVNRAGKKPGQKGYRGGSKIRPHLRRRRRKRR